LRFKPYLRVVGAVDSSMPCVVVAPKLFTSGSKCVYFGKPGARNQRFLPVTLNVREAIGSFLNIDFGKSYASVISRKR